MVAETVIGASWLTSGWIDVAMIVGWMTLVALIGARVWRAGDDHPPSPVDGAAGGARRRKRRAR